MIRTHRGDTYGLDDNIAQSHGTFRLQLHFGTRRKSLFSYNKQGIVSLTWVAPWAIDSLRQAIIMN
jgi:hypothetical protein